MQDMDIAQPAKKRPLWPRILGAVLFVLLLVAAFLYWRFSQFANIRPALGDGRVADIQLPDNFTIGVFAEGLDNVRLMAVGPDGVLYAADRGNRRIVALPDEDGDGVADEVRVFADEVGQVHSIEWHEDAWYAGVPTGVIRLRDTNGDGVADERTTLIDDFPTGGHNTRTVEFLPDGRMVVSVGSSCNVCEEDDPRRAALVAYDSYDGATATGETLFATGLRNAVGLAIHPQTGALWASNNGRDLMGDDTPPETVYRVEEGMDAGWPRCHSGRIPDPEFGFDSACDGVADPVVEMQAHSAPLGLTFYDGDLFPPEYRGDLFIAFHGSWNRSVPTGYKVVRLDFTDGQPAEAVEDFASGWLHPDGSASGRPVGVTVGSDGALYVSDDKGGFIYRIGYR